MTWRLAGGSSVGRRLGLSAGRLCPLLRARRWPLWFSLLIRGWLLRTGSRFVIRRLSPITLRIRWLIRHVSLVGLILIAPVLIGLVRHLRRVTLTIGLGRRCLGLIIGRLRLWLKFMSRMPAIVIVEIPLATFATDRPVTSLIVLK